MELTKIVKSWINTDSDIQDPPYNYDLIMNIEEKDYPKYLKKIFKYQTGQDLNLKNPKTYNEKIQWLKLYDDSVLRTKLTDKILVRDYITEKIGSKYLKPILWKGNNFDDIPFDSLPDRFFIKTNHGCKWHCYIKDKNKLLNDSQLFKYMRIRFNSWLQQSFFGWSAFELQYKKIVPQIYIEPVLFDESSLCPIDIEVYCFNSKPKLFRFLKYAEANSETLYDNDFKLLSKFDNIRPADDETKIKLHNLSSILSQEFKFVRVDWIVFNETLYFNELTFTPGSGLVNFPDKSVEKYLNSCLKIK